jgi:predicted RNA-binding Zn ribbon-like protein
MKTALSFQFVGGNLALDFVNTVSNRLAPDSERDSLRTPRDLAVWEAAAGLAERGLFRRVSSLRDGLTLREALYRIFRSHLVHRSPKAGDMEVLNRFVSRARAHWRVERKSGGYKWSWTEEGPRISPALARVAEAATALLVSEEMAFLRQCADEACGWLFLDNSQGRRRKWCSMRDCGNRAKARRHHQRIRRRGGQNR